MTHNNPKLTAKIALYQPDIPQNTASIIRTCSCLGVKLEIIEPCGFTFHDKRFRRVVMDYLDEKMIKIYENLDQFFEAKKNKSIFASVKGGMAEWSNAAVLKTVEGHTSGGSNPSFSASKFPNVFNINMLGFFVLIIFIIYCSDPIYLMLRNFKSRTTVVDYQKIFCIN